MLDYYTIEETASWLMLRVGLQNEDIFVVVVKHLVIQYCLKNKLYN